MEIQLKMIKVKSLELIIITINATILRMLPAYIKDEVEANFNRNVQQGMGVRYLRCFLRINKIFK